MVWHRLTEVGGARYLEMEVGNQEEDGEGV